MHRIRFLFVSISLLLLSLNSWAEVIDTREFFKNSQVRSAQISPDGEHLALTYEEGSEVKLAVMNIDKREILSSFEFGKNQHVLSFWWGSNKRVIMSVGEVTGNLDNLGRPAYWYAADIDGRQRKQIYDATNAGYRMLNTLPDDERFVLVARYHWADRGEPKANLLDMYTGEYRYRGDQPLDNDLIALFVDRDGNTRGAAALKMGDTLDDRDLRIYVKRRDEWVSLDFDSSRSSPNISFEGFSHDNRYAYLLSNHDMAANDRLGLFRYDFANDELELMHRDPDVDVSGLLRVPSGEIVGAYTRLLGPIRYTFFEDQVEAHKEQAQLLQSLIVSFPDNNVLITSASEDGQRAVVMVSGDRTPAEFYLFEAETRQLSLLHSALPDLPQDRLAEMEAYRITARDGLVLHALLTRPNDVRENLPLVVNVHGGPFGPRDNWGYQPEAQFLAHHGIATLQVNFRGSGGQGEDFTHAGFQQWGGRMQDDVTDATRWAIERGIADPERICIYGGSYGGYAALMGVIKEPDLYQCAIGYVGVYDLPWFRTGDGSDISRQRGAGREGRAGFERFMSSAVGNDLERLRENSPVHNVDKIKAELFLVHGGSDVRVVVGHYERLRAALDEIGKSYESLLKEEEGHGFFDVDNRVELYDRMLAFLQRHIGTGTPDGERE